MASLFALGVMSLIWMAGVAAADRLREAGSVAAYSDLRDGRVLLVLGTLVLAGPRLRSPG